MSTDQAIQAKNMYETALLNKANVVGVAVGFKEEKGATSGEVSVVVLVQEKKPLSALSSEDVIPPELAGMRTDVLEVGFLQAHQATQPRARFRPVPGGVSLAHTKVTAGTFGTLVKDRATNELFILSNNHVLASSNDAVKGDAILQPGSMDGGAAPGDVIAYLERFIPLRYIGDPVETPAPVPQPPAPKPPVNQPVPAGGCDVVNVVAGLVNTLGTLLGSEKRVAVTTQAAAQAASSAPLPPAPAAAASTFPENRVDCALARPASGMSFTGEILNIGKVTGTAVPMLGMRVAKMGRTTGYTEGNITLLNATVDISYNTSKGQRTARFVNQVITQGMSQGGDSGSLVVDAANKSSAVGLLFAGSNLATIFTPIDQVLNALNVALM